MDRVSKPQVNETVWRQKMKKKPKLDKFEKEIEESLERGEWQSLPKSEANRFESMANESVEVKSQTIETVYIKLSGLEGKIKVSNPDKIPNLKAVLEKKYPIVLHVGWEHTVDKVFTNKTLADFHNSWFDPSDKGGLSLFLCDSINDSLAFNPVYGLAYYSKGDADTDESIVEIKSVSTTNCFPR